MPEESGGQTFEERATVVGWETAGDRVVWLLKNQFQGNKSEMARAIGLSHTAIWKIVKRGKPPGPRILTAIAEKLGVSTDWLLKGLGQPVTNPGEVPRPLRMAMSDKLFLERLPDQLVKLTGRDDTIIMPTLRNSSQYWYHLNRGHPILAEPKRGFLQGDLLLMETNPERFPPVARLHDTICAVNCDFGNGPAVKLGSVTFYQGSVEDDVARLEFETFDPDPAGASFVEDFIVRRHRDGRIESINRKGRLQTRRGSEQFTHSNYIEQPESYPRRIRYDDIVAVWLGLSFRHPYHSLPRP